MRGSSGRRRCRTGTVNLGRARGTGRDPAGIRNELASRQVALRLRRGKARVAVTSIDENRMLIVRSVLGYAEDRSVGALKRCCKLHSRRSCD